MIKQNLLIILSVLTALVSFSQQPIDVTEQTLKVGGVSTEEMFFAFAAGDQIIFSFSSVDNKELKEIEIDEWPSTSKFSDFKSTKIENKILSVTNTAVYKFRFYNSALSGRICRIKIQRVPASESTKNFNTAVTWKTLSDTSYYTVQEKYLLKQEYVPKILVPVTDFYVNSGSNAMFKGGKSRITFPVILPRNTVEWYYQFSASRDKEAIQQAKGTFNLVGQLSKLIDVTGGLKFGIDMLSQPPGADYCDVYVMDAFNSTQFEAKNPYRYFTAGTRENIKSGIVKMQGGAGGQFYIGIKNPDATQGVNIAIECVAITLEEEWGVHDVKKMNITFKTVPQFN